MFSNIADLADYYSNQEIRYKRTMAHRDAPLPPERNEIGEDLIPMVKRVKTEKATLADQRFTVLGFMREIVSKHPEIIKDKQTRDELLSENGPLSIENFNKDIFISLTSQNGPFKNINELSLEERFHFINELGIKLRGENKCAESYLTVDFITKAMGIDNFFRYEKDVTEEYNLKNYDVIKKARESWAKKEKELEDRQKEDIDTAPIYRKSAEHSSIELSPESKCTEKDRFSKQSSTLEKAPVTPNDIRLDRYGEKITDNLGIEQKSIQMVTNSEGR